MSKIKVAMFTGGNGTASIGKAMVADGMELTLLVNCYDDGKSTGRLREFIPGMLGPSDVRKNAARYGPAYLQEYLEYRSPEVMMSHWFAPWYRAFNEYECSTGKEFNKTDCPRGNILFAGCYLDHNRDFNVAVDAFTRKICPEVRILNVTDGRNLSLKARCGVQWYDEGQICTTVNLPHIDELVLVDPNVLHKSICPITPNINLEAFRALLVADVIVYGPGTQHSSLLPSYITQGVSQAILANKNALKVYVANLACDYDSVHDTVEALTQKFIRYMRDYPKWDDLVDYTLIADDAFLPQGRIPSLRVIGKYQTSQGQHDGPAVVAAIKGLMTSSPVVTTSTGSAIDSGTPLVP